MFKRNGEGTRGRGKKGEGKGNGREKGGGRGKGREREGVLTLILLEINHCLVCVCTGTSDDGCEELKYTRLMDSHVCYDLIPHTSKLVVFDTQLTVNTSMQFFLQRDALPWQDVCLFVCPSVCLSHTGIVPKRLNISSDFFNHRVATTF